MVKQTVKRASARLWFALSSPYQMWPDTLFSATNVLFCPLDKQTPVLIFLLPLPFKYAAQDLEEMFIRSTLCVVLFQTGLRQSTGLIPSQKAMWPAWCLSSSTISRQKQLQSSVKFSLHQSVNVNLLAPCEHCTGMAARNSSKWNC